MESHDTVFIEGGKKKEKKKRRVKLKSCSFSTLIARGRQRCSCDFISRYVVDAFGCWKAQLHNVREFVSCKINNSIYSLDDIYGITVRFLYSTLGGWLRWESKTTFQTIINTFVYLFRIFRMAASYKIKNHTKIMFLSSDSLKVKMYVPNFLQLCSCQVICILPLKIYFLFSAKLFDKILLVNLLWNECFERA